jgi:hypothetical protein
MTRVFQKHDHGLQRGDEVLVSGDWYPVIGYVGTHHPGGVATGNIYTNKPIGKYEPWMGYRIDYQQVEDCRRPSSEAS